MPTRLLLLAAAGAAGTLCRYGLGGLVQSGLGSTLPVGHAGRERGRLLRRRPPLRPLREPVAHQRHDAHDRLHRVPRRLHDLLELHAGDERASRATRSGSRPPATSSCRTSPVRPRCSPASSCRVSPRGGTMHLPENAELLRIFIGDSDRYHHKPLYEAIVETAREHHLAGRDRAARPPGLRRSQPHPHRQDPASVGRSAAWSSRSSTPRRRSRPSCPCSTR